MYTIMLYRHWQDHNQTFGNIVVFDEKRMPVFSCACIERGWRNNRRNESCVPQGRYPIVFERSPRFRSHLWELKNVPNRSECKIHVANSWHQLNGCICLGIKLKHIDKDKYIDVTSSKMTLDQFHRTMRGYRKATIIIKNSF